MLTYIFQYDLIHRTRGTTDLKKKVALFVSLEFRSRASVSVRLFHESLDIPVNHHWYLTHYKDLPKDVSVNLSLVAKHNKRNKRNT